MAEARRGGPRAPTHELFGGALSRALRLGLTALRSVLVCTGDDGGGTIAVNDSQIREELNRLVASIMDAKDELLEDDGKLGCAHVLESVAGECFTLAERIREARLVEVKGR